MATTGARWSSAAQRGAGQRRWKRELRSLTAVTVSLAAMTATVSPAGAVGVFVDESSRIPYVPEAETIVTDVEYVDVTKDGLPDLYLTRGDLSGAARTNLLFVNQGDGSFRPANGAGAVAADYSDADFGDVNGDGLLDAVLSVTLGPERLIIQQASRPRFADRTARNMPANQPLDVTISSELFDADGDGDLDIITANEDPFLPAGQGAQNRLYLNSGRGTFRDVTSSQLPAILDDSSAFAIGDFDRDGDNDLITVNDGPFVYLDNNGSGTFTNQTASHLPPQPTNRDSGRDAVVADIDSDGDLDAVFAISRSDQGPLLWLNNGTGVFVDASSSNMPLASFAAQELEACDIDADGDLDLVEANSGAILQPPTDHRFRGAAERLLINNGLGVFTDASGNLPDVLDASFSAACRDITGDGKADVVVANGKGEVLRVYVQT